MSGLPGAVVFDLDGTLVDSWSAHLSCLRGTCADLGLPVPSAARVRAAQRATDLGTLTALVGVAPAEAALAAYQRALPVVLSDVPVRPTPGAATALAELKRHGIACGVCTGRSRAGATALLDAAGLDIGLLVAREDAARAKPAPDGLLRALARLGVPADRAVYVGDTGDDRRQGEAAGVRTVLVGDRVPDGHGAVAALNDLVPLLRRGLA